MWDTGRSILVHVFISDWNQPKTFTTLTRRLFIFNWNRFYSTHKYCAFWLSIVQKGNAVHLLYASRKLLQWCMWDKPEGQSILVVICDWNQPKTFATFKLTTPHFYINRSYSHEIPQRCPLIISMQKPWKRYRKCDSIVSRYISTYVLVLVVAEELEVSNSPLIIARRYGSAQKIPYWTRSQGSQKGA